MAPRCGMIWPSANSPYLSAVLLVMSAGGGGTGHTFIRLVAQPATQVLGHSHLTRLHQGAVVGRWCRRTGLRIYQRIEPLLDQCPGWKRIHAERWRPFETEGK